MESVICWLLPAALPPLHLLALPTSVSFREQLFRHEVVFYGNPTHIVNTVLTVLTKEYFSILIHIIRELPGSLFSCKFMHRTTSFCFLHIGGLICSAMLSHTSIIAS